MKGKKWLSLLLAVTMVLQTGFTSNAQTNVTDGEAAMVVSETADTTEDVIADATDEVTESASMDCAMMVNPVYADVANNDDVISDSSSIGAVQSTGVSSYTTISSAARYVKQQMLARNTAIIQFDYIMSSCPAGKTAQIYSDIMEKVYAITTNPQEGDYLRYHVYLFPDVDKMKQPWIKNGSTYVITYYLQFGYVSTALQESVMASAIKTAVSSLKLTYCADLEKVKKIHDYICKNVSYDKTKNKDVKKYPTQYSAYGALHDKTAVCQGYATLFYAMCIQAGISARVITGTADGNHAWNIVKVGSKWYNIDTTWDSQSYGVVYNYFLKNDAKFSDHSRAIEYTTASFYSSYPMYESSYSGSAGSSKITKVTSAGYNLLKLTWTKSSSATGYYIYYATSKNGTYTKATTKKGGAVTTCIITKCTPGKTYYFKVRPYANTYGTTVKGKYSAAVSGKAVPATVELKSVASGSKSLTVKWQTVSGASGYQVNIKYVYHGKTVTKKVKVSAKKLKTTVTGLKKGTVCTVRVQAYTEGKVYGAYSSKKKITIK